MKLSPTTQKIIGVLWLGVGILGIAIGIHMGDYPTDKGSLIAPICLIISLAGLALYNYFKKK